MRPPDEVKKVIVRQWLSKADQDLSASEALLAAEPPLFYPACFHAQQAVEKYLKALLSWRQTEFPKTHSIEELLELAARTDAGLAANLKDAVALTPYGVEIRYPGDAPDPDSNDARQAVAIARTVRDVIIDCLKETS